jgi:hypothetical protein
LVTGIIKTKAKLAKIAWKMSVANHERITIWAIATLQ